MLGGVAHVTHRSYAANKMPGNRNSRSCFAGADSSVSLILCGNFSMHLDRLCPILNVEAGC
jgi:hypothetical protein